MLEYRDFYRRNLPHYQPLGAILFITTRLTDSIPQEVLLQLLREREAIDEFIDSIPDAKERIERAYLEQRRAFAKWDNYLDAVSTSPTWLTQPEIASLLA